MKVLFLTPGLGAGGAERQLSVLLPGLRRGGTDARLVALDSGGPFEAPLRDAGVPLEVLAMRHQLDLSAVRHSQLLRRFAPDVVVSLSVSGLYAGAAVARLRRVPQWFSDHRGVGFALTRRREAMVRLLARRLNGIIVVSEDQRAVWQRYGAGRVPIVHIPNGVETAAPGRERDEVRRELGVGSDAIVALMVASLKPIKRVFDFVAAVQGARAQVPELVGVIAGDGPDRAGVESAARQSGAVAVLGQRSDVPRLLQAADLLVLCSEYEALPMSVLEGMAAGLPVLATRVGGLPTVVADGQSGLLVAPGDLGALTAGVVALAADAERRRAMGVAGRQRVRERWSAEAMIAAYEQVLRDAVAARARART